MTKTCIGCKREIAKEQSRCYICNASQSYIRYYARSVFFIILTVLSSAALVHWYSQQSSRALIEGQAQQLSNEKQANEQQLLTLKAKLDQANQTIVDLEQNTNTEKSETNQQLAKSQLALKEAQSAAEKTTARASWLSKENGRFKAKIAELESKLSASTEQGTAGQQLTKESILSQLLTKSRASQQQLLQLKEKQLTDLENANNLKASDSDVPGVDKQSDNPLKQAIEETERQLAEFAAIIEFLQKELASE